MYSDKHRSIFRANYHVEGQFLPLQKVVPDIGLQKVLDKYSPVFVLFTLQFYQIWSTSYFFYCRLMCLGKIITKQTEK